MTMRQRRQRGNSVGNGNGKAGTNIVVRGQQQKQQAAMNRQDPPSTKIPSLSGVQIGQDLTYGAALDLCYAISSTTMVPMNYRGKPEDTFAAMLYGVEVGLSPMQAVWSVNVINGRPGLSAEGMLAIAKCHPAFDDLHEDPQETHCTCTVQRKGLNNPVVRKFTVDDAKRANLWGRRGPWTEHPKRMLQMRARSWALRDAFPDALKGLPLDDEVQYMNDPQPEQPQQGHGFSFVKPVPMPEPPPPVVTMKEETVPELDNINPNHVEPETDDEVNAAMDVEMSLEDQINAAKTKMDLASIDFSKVDQLEHLGKEELRAIYQKKMAEISAPQKQDTFISTSAPSGKIPAMGVA